MYQDKTINNKKIRIGYCDIFNLDLLNLFQEPDFPATRVHLTKSKFLDFEEPSTRCSFTDIYISDLDPRSPISITRISNDITALQVINWTRY